MLRIFHAMPTLQELAAILGRIHNSPDKYIFDIWADPAVRSIPPPPDVDPATIWKPFEDWARGHSELLQRIQYQAAYEDWARRDSERIRTGGQESDEPMSPISERSGSEETAVAPMENLAICDDGQESDTEPSCREETAVAPRENLAIRDSFTTHVSKTLAVARVPPEQRPPESSNRRENKTESPAPAADGPHPPRHPPPLYLLNLYRLGLPIPPKPPKEVTGVSVPVTVLPYGLKPKAAGAWCRKIESWRRT